MSEHDLSLVTAADGQADGEDCQGDDAGDDEGEGGGEERLERSGVVLGRLLAPVTAVHRAAEEPGARGPAVLTGVSTELVQELCQTVSPYRVNQARDMRDNTRIRTIRGFRKTLMVDITVTINSDRTRLVRSVPNIVISLASLE